MLVKNRSLHVHNLGVSCKFASSCLKFFSFALHCSTPEKWLVFFLCTMEHDLVVLYLKK